MKPYTPAAYGLKGLPGPTGRGIHREAALQHKALAQADGTRSKTLVLLLKGGAYLETGKHDSVGKVQGVHGIIVAHRPAIGNATGVLAEATQTRLTTAVETAWLAAGSFCQRRSEQMTTPSKQRTQVYAALLALTMLGLAITCAQVGAKAWQQTGPASAWLSFVAASLLALGAVTLLFYTVRSVRASLKIMRRRASRSSSGTPDGEVNPRR